MRLIQRLLSTRGKYVRDTTWDIILKVVTSWANQKIGINKYFNVSNYTIDWWDGTTTTATTTNSSWAHSKTYASAWTYYITLVNPWGRWTFTTASYGLVPSSWFTGASVWVEYMPSLKDWFGDGASNPWDYFFSYFNRDWALTSLPTWSFNTSNITSVWSSFFRAFNDSWALTSLPSWSFDTSNITSVWDYFFYYFNYFWALTSLPAWSFNTSNITSVWVNFFNGFNYFWALTSLPAWSFNTSNITSVWSLFFSNFNYSWSIPKVSAWTGVAIKNVSSDNVVFHYAPSNSSDSISAWNTFDWYAKS